MGINSGSRFIRFDENTVKSFTGELVNGVTDRYMREKANQVQRIAKSKVGVKSGKLRNSIRVNRLPNRNGVAAYSIGSRLDYAYWHHEGSGKVRKYTTPRNMKALKFFWPARNQIVYYNKVRYTYRKPNRFLTDALTIVFGR